MEFKKCERCGSFYFSNDNVCYNCLTKENLEIAKFQTYIEENNINDINSLNYISIQTGISEKTLNRFLNYEDFSDVTKKFNLD